MPSKPRLNEAVGVGVSTWTASQRSVLKEIGIPLLRLRSDDAEQHDEHQSLVDAESAPNIAGWGVSGSADSLVALKSAHWFAQLRRFLAGFDFELIESQSPTRMHAPGQMPMDLDRAVLTVTEKRALYELARRALSGRL